MPLEDIALEIACTACDAVFETEDEAWDHAERFYKHRLLGKKISITENETEYDFTFWIPPFDGYFPRESYE